MWSAEVISLGILRSRLCFWKSEGRLLDNDTLLFYTLSLSNKQRHPAHGVVARTLTLIRRNCGRCNETRSITESPDRISIQIIAFLFANLSQVMVAKVPREGLFLSLLYRKETTFDEQLVASVGYHAQNGIPISAEIYK